LLTLTLAVFPFRCFRVWRRKTVAALHRLLSAKLQIGGLLLLLAAPRTLGGEVVAWGSATNLATGLTNVMAISGGLSLIGDGTVMSGDTNLIAGLSNIVGVAGGTLHGAALGADGRVAVWGDNSFGELEVPVNLTNAIAISAGEGRTLVLRSDGSLTAWGLNAYGNASIPAGLGTVVAIVCGGYHNLVLRSDGTVAAWGYNANGQCNVPFGLNNVVQIAAGYNHSVALQADGTVLAWGWNNSGQINLPAGLSNVVAVGTGFEHNLALRADGTLVTWGANGSGQCTIPDGLTHVVAVSGLGYFSAALTDTVLAPRVVQQPLNATILAGTPAMFRTAAVGAPPCSYQWRFNHTNLAGAGMSALPLAAATPALAGVYSVVISNAYGSVESSDATLTVLPLIITNHPVSQTWYGGDTASFQAGAIGQGPLGYQWRFNGADLPAQTNSTLSLVGIGTNQAGSYSVLVSNVYGAVESSNALLTVIPLSISTPPTNRTIYSGENADFNVAAIKNGPFSYQWRFNQADLPGATNASLSLSGVAASQAGSYSVLVSNPYGSIQSPGATLTVVEAAPKILAQPSNGVTWPGGGVAFRVVADGSKPLSYRWRFNGVEIAAATNATLVVWPVTTSNVGNYSVLVSNYVLVTPSATATLTLSALPLAAWGGVSALPATLTNPVAIAAGYDHCLALKPDGTVVAWGSVTTVPSYVTNIVAIAAGDRQSWALQSGGSLLAWGQSINSSTGLLGNVVAISAGYDWLAHPGYRNGLLAVRADGSVVGLGATLSVSNTPPGLNSVVSVAAGTYHYLALRSDGTVKAWSDYSDYNANQVPAQLRDVVAIAAGFRHSVALKADGTVAAWGQNAYGSYSGMTSVPAGLSNVVAIAAGQVHSLALRADGSIVAWGANGSGQTNVIPYLPSAAAVAGGWNYSLALPARSDPVMVRQPQSASGLPGQPVLLSIGAVSHDPLTYQWQFNGQNLQGATNSYYEIPALVRSLQGGYSVIITSPSATRTSAVARVSMSGNALVAWGNGSQGQTNVPPGLDATAVAGGLGHTIALRRDGSVAAWGWNTYTVTNLPGSVSNGVSAVAAGATHNLALRTNHTVVAWGDSSSGKTTVPANLSNVIAIAAGSTYSLALKLDGKTTQWGALAPPPAGLSNLVAISGGYNHVAALKADGSVVSWGSTPPAVSANSNIVAVAAGNGFTLVLKTDGQVSATGNNAFGQTTVPAGLSNVVAIAAGGYSALAVKADGTPVGWGRPDFNLKPPPAGLSNVVALAGGDTHSLALLGSADPAIVRQPAPVYANVYSHVLLSVGACSSQPMSFQWRLNGTDLPGATNWWLNLHAVQAQDSGSYSVRVSNGLAAAVSADALVFVSNTAPFILRQPVGQTNVGGASAAFTITADGSAPLHYQWLRNGVALDAATGSSLALGNLARSNQAAYSVVLSNPFGSLVSTNAYLRVLVPQTLFGIRAADGPFVLLSADSDGGALTALDPGHFEIQASTNLLDWAVPTHVPTVTNGMLQWTDEASPDFPQRFYRMVEKP
jgi:alpha-tubulin suppressor-like RCC1 family protein